jgi:alpha,alpha-trehalase
MSEWKLIYESFEPGQEGLREALCTLGNGYFATRGAAEEAEADDVHYPGTYLAGGYNRLQTDVAGRVIENEDLVNLPNWLCLSFRPEGSDWFNLKRLEVLAYRQELDLKQGLLARHVRFRDRDERETTLVSRRLVHMAAPHLAAIEMTLRPENWSGRVEIRSAIDGRVINTGVERYRQLSGKHLEPRQTAEVGEDGVLLVAETNQSHLRVAQAARTRVYRGDEPLPVERRMHREQDYIRQDLSLEVVQGQEVAIEKIVALYTSRDRAISEPGLEAGKAIGEAGRFQELLEPHKLAWGQLWRRCDVVLGGQERTQMILRLHIFHMLQTASLNTVDLDVGVPARGLHGEAYRGHIFWDELFIFPFLDFRIPEITRALLMYRYRRLPEARRLAKEAGFAGAMYPWQSGSNGREESQVLHLNPRSGRWLPDDTHLQRHVNAGIAYNVWRHYEITGDHEFLFFYGAEMIVEIARFWASIATWNAERGRYEIKGVVGPDEFHTRYPGRDEPGLDNNAYTNVMATWVLARALDVLDLLEDERRDEIKQSLGLTDGEIARWDEVSRKMRVVFHGDGVISQFEDYDRLEELDWEAYRKRHGDIHRLDRILEAEGDTINRYKASKQADVLMLFYLFSADELRDLFARLGYPFERETIPKTIDYYIHRTSHGSTLSRVVHSWVLARSDRTRSWQLLAEALESDVADVQGGTTPEGIHLGAMAGTVDLVQRGQTGIEIRHGLLRLNPCVPPELQDLRLRVRYCGQWIELEISCDAMTVRTPAGWTGPNRIAVHDEVREFQPGETLRFTCRHSQEQALPRSLAETSAK